MKIVHLSTTDYGGAYTATKRISESMSQCGIDSKVVVRTKTKESEIIEANNSIIKKLFSKIRNVINLVWYDNGVVYDCFGTNVTKVNQVDDADIVFVHWINSFLTPRLILKIAMMNKPVVWVLHDMWPFTGGCHCDYFCGKYKVNSVDELPCESCPQTKKQNICSKNVSEKIKLNQNAAIDYIALSKWEYDEAKASKLIENQRIELIPNPIDTDKFIVRDKTEVRERLGVNLEKHIVLFGADKVSGNPNKGFGLLVECLKQLDDKYEAYCFGNVADCDKVYLDNIKVNYVGRLDEAQLIDWYNASDVLVVPSTQESFCYTCCEALSCGTPVVGFKTGGLLDQIEHKGNGYLAEIGDVAGLVEGIAYWTEIDTLDREQCHAKVEKTNSYKVIGEKYAIFAKELLGKRCYE